MSDVSTLDAIFRAPACAAELSRAILGELLAQVAAVQSTLTARLITDASKNGETEAKKTISQSQAERLLAAPEVAVMLGYAKSYVYELLRREICRRAPQEIRARKILRGAEIHRPARAARV